MKESNILGMMSGLSLLFFGMNLLNEGLENLTGNQLSIILRRLTDHKLKAVCVGMIVTAFIQSSSAMTVMLVGFVNSGIMPLENAIWVVMGANIGTTITGQMLALNIGYLAPILSLMGTILFVFIKSLYIKYIGKSFIGLGFLFMGLEIMSISLIPLQNSSLFSILLQWMSSPVLGIFIGMIFTGIIQSSSASIGILQSLAKIGMVSLNQATYIIFGFDIGTCVTAFLASLSGSRSGKQLALFHMILNIFGTIVFTMICMLTPFIHMIAMLTPNHIMTQIANMHTIFNIGTTLFALSFDQYLLKAIYKILPPNKKELT